MMAIDASSLSGAPKATLLLTVAGGKALDLFNSFPLSPEDSEDFDKVLANLRLIAFLERVKLPKDSFSTQECKRNGIEDYITDLKCKIQSCNFGPLRESLIRDRLMVGCNDVKLQEHLLIDCGLALEKIINSCKVGEKAKLKMQAFKQRG